MKRIVWHWTAGGYRSTAYERSRYHFLIEYDEATGRANVVEGDKPPEVNRSPLGPDYVRHAGGFNSDAIGVAMCCMGGPDVRERPLVIGRYPPQRAQWDACADLTADLCETYGIKVGLNTTLMHSEVRPRFGVGRYKWDVNLLPNMTELVSPQASGGAMRQRVAQELENRQREAPVPPWWQRLLRQWGWT